MDQRRMSQLSVQFLGQMKTEEGGESKRLGMALRQGGGDEGLGDRLTNHDKAVGVNDAKVNYAPSTSMACPEDLEHNAPEGSMKKTFESVSVDSRSLGAKCN